MVPFDPVSFVPQKTSRQDVLFNVQFPKNRLHTGVKGFAGSYLREGLLLLFYKRDGQPGLDTFYSGG
jgi:hypothetical protein